MNPMWNVKPDQQGGLYNQPLASNTGAPNPSTGIGILGAASQQQQQPFGLPASTSNTATLGTPPNAQAWANFGNKIATPANFTPITATLPQTQNPGGIPSPFTQSINQNNTLYGAAKPNPFQLPPALAPYAGNKPQPTLASSVLGASALGGSTFGGGTAQQGTSTTNAFGQQPNTFGQQPSAFGQQTGAFGQQPSAFGQQPNAFGQQPNAYGQQTNPFGQLSNSLVLSRPGGFGQSVVGAGFGQSQGSLVQSSPFATSRLGKRNQQQTTIDDRVQYIRKAWDPRSPDCRFQHFFYNVLGPQEIGGSYVKPELAKQELWERALLGNPNPSNLVPVLSVGFEGLKERMDMQVKQAQAHAYRLREIADKIENLRETHSIRLTVRIEQAKLVEAHLHQRILALCTRLHMLIPSTRSSPIRPEEEQLATALEELDAEFRKGSGSGRIRGKVNELWTALGAVKAQKEREIFEGKADTTEWVIADEKGFNDLTKVLGDQYRALEYMAKVLESDGFDVDHIRREGFGLHS